jgi:cysteinyl-tRNA synthetase
MQAMNEVEQIEVTIEAVKEKIKMRKALKRLTKNKDFQLIVDTGYLEQEAVRLVLLKADYNMADEQNQAFIIRAIDSIGNLRQYFSNIMLQGRQAEAALSEHEQTREALLQEDMVEDVVGTEEGADE